MLQKSMTATSGSRRLWLWLRRRCKTRCRSSTKASAARQVCWSLQTAQVCSRPGPELAGEGRQGFDRPAWGVGEAARGEGLRPPEKAGEPLDSRREAPGESIPLQHTVGAIYFNNCVKGSCAYLWRSGKQKRHTELEWEHHRHATQCCYDRLCLQIQGTRSCPSQIQGMHVTGNNFKTRNAHSMFKTERAVHHKGTPDCI